MLPTPLRAGALACALALAAPHALAQDGAFPSGAPRVVDVPAGGAEVPVTLVNRRPTVEVRVDGRGPFRFIVETGAPWSALTPAAIGELGLVADAGGAFHLDSVALGGAVLRDFRVASLELPWSDVHGVLGLNAYRDLLLTVDYPASRVRLEKGALPDPDGVELLRAIPVGPFWGVRVDVAGREVDAVLDTQSEHAFSAVPTLAEGLPLEAAPVLTGYAAGPGIGLQDLGTARLAGDVRLGGYTFRRPLLSLSPMPPHIPQSWNVGGKVLHEFAVTLDQRRRVIRLARPTREPFAAPPALLGFGFRAPTRDGTRVVSDVVPGGPADRAGIRAGDQVLGVDGRPAAGAGAPRWADLAAAGTPVRFRLRRGGEEREVTLSPVVVVS